LEGYHLRTIERSEINCVECRNLWLAKWNNENSLTKDKVWDLIIEKKVMRPAKSIGVVGQIDTSACSSAYDFIQYTRKRNYGIAAIGLKTNNRVFATIESNEGILVADQEYVKFKDQWILDTTYNYYSGFKNFDINKNN
jgi:hypothetical protein